MNKIYKNVWNHVTRTFTAVSEIKTKKGKVGKSVLATTVTSLILGCGSTSVYADRYSSDIMGNDTIDLGQFYIGNNSQSGIKREDETTLRKGVFGDGIGLSFSLGNANYDDIEGTQGLLSQGTSGFRQFIFESGDLSISEEGIDRFDEMFNTSAHGSLSQGLVQDGQNVATLHYAAAGRAYQLFLRNQGTIDANYEVESNGRIYFDGVRLGYTDDGIAIAYKDIDPEGLYLLTFLTGIELKQGQTLVLDGLDNTEDPNHRNVLSPIISGSGSLTLKGSGSVDIESVITLDENGNAYDSANTYTGETTIGSSDENTFVVNLNKKDSFGQTSKLTATNAQINVKTTDAWTSVQRIDSTKSTINFASSQISFSITGSDAAGAPAALFTGDNVINAAADTLTLNVTNGSLEVGREAGKDDNPIFSTGSLTIQNPDANSQSLVLSIANNLNINGDSLLNLANSADSGKINVEQNVTFNQVSDLAKYGIKADALTAKNGTVSLVESNGEYSLNTLAKTFLVKGGVVQIAAGTAVDVEKTDVVSGASLKASYAQLGQNISILNDNAETKSAIRVSYSGGDLNFTKKVSGDGVLHLDLGNQSDPNLAGELTFAENTSDDENTILVRLSNATYKYDSTDGFSNYVVGGGGTIKFDSPTSDVIKLDTIGWQYLAENPEKSGVIDLSGHEFTLGSGPAIEAGKIHFESSDNELWIDKDDFLDVSGSTERGNILVLDSANPERILIKGEKSSDSPADDLINITLKDKNGIDIASSDSTYLASSNGLDNAAKLDWSIGASYRTKEDEGPGIYLDYSVQTITLLNGSTTDDPAKNQVLQYGSALVAAGDVDGTDNSLASRLSGYGILEFKNGDSTKGPVTISIANLSNNEAERNNYGGATVVREQTKLQSTGSGLGDSTLVLIGEKADFELLASGVGTDTAIKGITTDDAAHTITVDQDRTLTLEGSTLEQEDLDSLYAGYHSRLQRGNVLGTNTLLSGAGRLKLVSDLEAKSAVAFNTFGGSVSLSGDEARTLTIGSEDQETTLTKGVFVSEGTDNHVIELKTGAQIGADNGVDGADFKVFHGILKFGENLTFSVYDMGSLGDSVLQAADGVRLVMNGISGSLLNGDNAEYEDDKGDLIVLTGATATLKAVGSKSASLDFNSIKFEDTKNGHFNLELQGSDVSLEKGRQDISGQYSVSLDKGSTLRLTGTGENVDWSGLHSAVDSATDTTSTVILTGSTVAGQYNKLTIGAIAADFIGTAQFKGFDFTFGKGEVSGENAGHDELLQKHNFVFENSKLTANGESTVKDLTLKDSILSFTEREQVAKGGSSSSLITVEKDGKLNLGGSQIRIDTSKLQLDFNDDQSGTTNKSLLEALNEAQGKDDKYFQLVSGDVEGAGGLTDLDGTELEETSSVSVSDGDELVAKLGFGAKLIDDDVNDADGTGLWVGQGLQELELQKSVTLNAGDGSGLTLNGDVFEIEAKINSATDGVNLTIVGETPIQLNAAEGNITGQTSIADGGHLILNNTNALSTDGAVVAVREKGTLTVNAAVSQKIHGLQVDGKLNLAEGSELVVGGEGVEDASVLINSSADLTGAEGTWSLDEKALMVIDVVEGRQQSLTGGNIKGGTLTKTGAGDLMLRHSFLNGSNTNVQVAGGSLSISDWTQTLAVGAMLLQNTTFELDGDLRVATAFEAGIGSTTYIGSRDFEQSDRTFKRRTIDGDFSASGGTLVFNTALGVDSSDGDSLTITGDATGNVNLLIHNTTNVRDGYQDLTILSVGGNVEGFNPTTEFDADGYAYRLGSTTSDGGTDYFLTSKADGGDSGSDGESMISARLGSLTGFAASFDMFSMSIHDRQGTRPWINPVTGEKTMTSLWLRQTATLENAGNSNGQLDSRNNEYVTTLGGDILQLNAQENGYVFAGLMAGYGTSDYETESNLSGRAGRTDTDGWMVGAYGGWHQNNPETDRTGLYVAGWVQYAHFKADISQSGDPMTVRADGISASLEAGWIVKAAEFQMQGGATQGALYIEPHAQVTWSGVDSENLSDKNMDIYGQHNITTRLGARFTLETSGATNFSPYLEANWVHNTKDIGARWGDVTSYEEGADNQAEFKLGAETFFTDSFSGYAQIRANWGGDGYNRQEGSLGLKYRF